MAGPSTRASVITTSGDRIKDRPLREFGGKGLFTKEIDAALLEGRVDIAVHSMKDLPTEPPMDSQSPRCSSAPSRDAFVSRAAPSLEALPSAPWSAPRRCGVRRK